jgi:hypothetical protein
MVQLVSRHEIGNDSLWPLQKKEFASDANISNPPQYLALLFHLSLICSILPYLSKMKKVAKTIVWLVGDVICRYFGALSARVFDALIN